MTELLLHPKINEKLSKIMANPPHALLVIGPKGAGKSTFIRHIATNLLKTQNLQNHPYVRFVNADDGDGIAHIRDIRTFLTLKTTGNNKIRRLVILENVEILGTDAQNAILKTIEEPPTDTVILLTASSTGPILETILSRVAKLQILPLDANTTNNYESYSEDETSMAYALSGGYAGSFKTILESDAENEIKKSISLAKEFLGQTIYERLCVVEIISKDKLVITLLLDGLERCLHAALKNTKNISQKSLISKLEYIDKIQASIANNVNSKLLLTALAINI